MSRDLTVNKNLFFISGLTLFPLTLFLLFFLLCFLICSCSSAILKLVSHFHLYFGSFQSGRLVFFTIFLLLSFLFFHSLLFSSSKSHILFSDFHIYSYFFQRDFSFHFFIDIYFLLYLLSLSPLLIFIFILIFFESSCVLYFYRFALCLYFLFTFVDLVYFLYSCNCLSNCFFSVSSQKGLPVFYFVFFSVCHSPLIFMSFLSVVFSRVFHSHFFLFFPLIIRFRAILLLSGFLVFLIGFLCSVFYSPLRIDICISPSWFFSCLSFS